MVANTIEQRSYEFTAEALAEQERSLAGLRARAGTILAAVTTPTARFSTATKA